MADSISIFIQMIIISLRKLSVHLWLSDQNHCQYTIASQKGYLQSIHWRSSLNFSDLSTNPDFYDKPNNCNLPR